MVVRGGKDRHCRVVGRAGANSSRKSKGWARLPELGADGVTRGLLQGDARTVSVAAPRRRWPVRGFSRQRNWGVRPVPELRPGPRHAVNRRPASQCRSRLRPLLDIQLLRRALPALRPATAAKFSRQNLAIASWSGFGWPPPSARPDRARWPARYGAKRRCRSRSSRSVAPASCAASTAPPPCRAR